jgi:hypothetical protein
VKERVLLAAFGRVDRDHSGHRELPPQGGWDDGRSPGHHAGAFAYQEVIMVKGQIVTIRGKDGVDRTMRCVECGPNAHGGFSAGFEPVWSWENGPRYRVDYADVRLEPDQVFLAPLLPDGVFFDSGKGRC